MTHRPRSGARGFSTLEALVASAVLAIGMVALARLHIDLRAGSQAARERSEAVRLAQQDLEALRAFAGAAGFEAIADAEAQDVTPPGSATRYRRERRVAVEAAGALKSVQVSLRWTDRQGAPQVLVLRTLIQGDDPALSAALAMPRPGL